MTSHSLPDASSPLFLQSGGETGDIIANFPWETTSLGALAVWPGYLQTTIGMILRSPVPIVTLWGDDGIMIYNDAYSVFAAGRHPTLLGSKVREGWPEVADFNDNVMRVCLKGGTLAYRDQELTLYRNGGAEQVWMNLDYSPVVDHDGCPAGVISIVVETTAKVRAERWMSSEQERLRRMFEQAPGFMAMLTGPDHIFESVNPAFSRLIGHRPILGMKARNAFPYRESQRFASKLDALYASGETFKATSMPIDLSSPPVSIHQRRASDVEHYSEQNEQGETEHQGKHHAEIRYVDVVYQPLRSASGDVIGIFIQGADVTERVQAQQAVEASEANFRTLAQALPTQVWTANAAGQLDWFNDRAYAYSAIPRGSLNTSTWASMIHPDDVERTRQRWSIAVASGDPYENEVRLRGADGTFRWHLSRAFAVIDSIQRVTRWVGTSTDIHRQKDESQYLSHLNETLEQQVADRTADRDRMWRLSPDVMLVAQFDAGITAVNPAWTSLLGWHESELIGRSFMALVHPADRAVTLAEMVSLSEGNQTLRFENRLQRKDGGYSTLSWTAVPDERYVHAVGRDVTAERAAQAAHERTELALQQAQKMETIGKLTGGVAHDFNNLLQVISGNLQLLNNDIGGRVEGLGNERAQRWVHNALAGVERGAKLASQLLAFGRRQALAPKAIKIGRLVSGMDDLLRRSLGEEIEIEMIVSGGLWSTFADPVHIENAILNLAINARDAMDGIGKLTIEVGNAYLDSQYAREHAEVSAGQYVMLAVTDTGSGMSKDVLAQVFEPFFSTKPEGKGTGLGLSMVYGFVKQSAGHVAIYSEPGQGTTVKVYLPRTQAEEDLAQPVTSLPVVGGAETILVAEDDADVRVTVVELLTELGYRVLKATDAHSALAIIDSGIPVDLLFTDVVMPGPLRSPDLARKAKERLPNIGVLFTSGYTENAIVHGGRLDPGVELLGKPYTREALALKIRHVLNGRPTTPPALVSALPVAPVAPAATLPPPTLSAAPTSTPPSTAPASAVAPETAQAEVTMLLVEDDDLIRWNTSELLQEMGYRVIEAADGRTALDILANTVIDILITDVGLPDINGEALAIQARVLQANIAVVFATGSDHVSSVRGSTVLRKPYDSAHLGAAVHLFVQKS